MVMPKLNPQYVRHEDPCPQSAAVVVVKESVIKVVAVTDIVHSSESWTCPKDFTDVVSERK